jgi:hypothetical protein
LKLDLFLVVTALMREVVMRSHGNGDSLSGDLDLETFTILKRIGEPPQLLDELGERVVFLDVPDGLLHLLRPLVFSDGGAVRANGLDSQDRLTAC